jgi:uncharacterized protein YecE (DUF72 family)
MARHWIGTSGWSYAHWGGGVFFPKGLKKTDWIGYYADRLNSVEINASFYHLPREAVLEGWVARTRDDFLFAVKAWRAITHYRRLADCAEHVETFFRRIAALGGKGGPVLFQLPPRFHADVARLDEFLGLLPKDRRCAFEFRDESWHTDAVYAALAEHNAAFCPFELAGRTAPRMVTADFVYVRLHGRKGRYAGNYGEAELGEWAGWLGARMAEARDVYVYFDNTDEADYALKNAQRLDAMLTERGSVTKPCVGGGRGPLSAHIDGTAFGSSEGESP